MPGPLYRKIADDLESKIESGELALGSQIPTETELGDLYSASRNTIRDAVKWLISRGLVETRPGQGTFVVDRDQPFVATLTGPPSMGQEGRILRANVPDAARKYPEQTQPRVGIQQATGRIARALRIMEGATVISRHQERLISGTPWSLQTTFYPMTLVARGATRLLEAPDIEGGTTSYLAGCGIPQVSYRDTISVRPPKQGEAHFFRLPPDGRVPVFDVYRVGFTGEGERIRLTITVYPTDRNWLRVEVGGVPQREAVG